MPNFISFKNDEGVVIEHYTTAALAAAELDGIDVIRGRKTHKIDKVPGHSVKAFVDPDVNPHVKKERSDFHRSLRKLK